MNHIIKDRLWYLMVLFSIFATIPEIIRFNFWGAVFAEKLSFFPLLAGLLLTLYYEKCHVFKTSLSRRIGIYLLIYAVVLFISLIHGWDGNHLFHFMKQMVVKGLDLMRISFMERIYTSFSVY